MIDNNPLGKKEFVEVLIPQRFPFVMVDKMFGYTETSLISGLKIQSDNLFFQNGNFTE